MGAGRKTQTFTASPYQDMATYTASMRNLRKNDLGGVIFGCKDFTINECLSKQLFGLPAAHFLYVKNISPGLPLFLFNYTDRKLHGIYEAASQGQMNINPYGWSTDGSKRTQFPAQIQIRTRLHCVPLIESQFKEIIADNYYTEYHFWFELDHSQTSKLVSKLASAAVAPSTPAPQRSKLASVGVGPSTSAPQSTMNWRSCFLPSKDTKEAALPSHDRIEAAPPSNNTAEATLSSHDTTEEPEWLEALTSEAEDWSNSSPNLDSPILFGRYDPLTSLLDVNEAEQVEQERIYMRLKELALQENLNSECQNVSFSGDVEDSAVVNEMSWEDNEEPWGSLGLEDKRADIPHSSFEEKSRQSPYPLSTQNSGESAQSLSDHHAIITKLIQEVDELKSFQTEQSKKIGYLEQKLGQAEIEIQHLKG